VKKANLLNLGLAVCLSGLFAGCASTQVTTEGQAQAFFPKPDRVFVYSFAVSPDEVTLDKGISAVIERAAKGASRTEEEKAAGREVADALANHLVTEIRALGLPASRAVGEPPADGNTLTIRGQFISIDEGNRTERVIIGLGLGRTDVKTMTQVRSLQNGKKTLMCEFSTEAKSGRKPGAAETMGAGAVAGHVVESAVVTGAATTVSEVHGATVEADADRTAKDIAKQLKNVFVDQTWITP
jgi:Domain of unknown function (DUF4410)